MAPNEAAVPRSVVPIATRVRVAPEVLRTAQGVVVPLVMVMTEVFGTLDETPPVTVTVPPTAKSPLNEPSEDQAVTPFGETPKTFTAVS